MPTLASTPAAPLITSVQCNSGGNLPAFSLSWTPQQGYTGPFTVLVTDGAGNAIVGTTTAASATGATWTATASMTAANNFYYVQVAVTGNLGIISDKAPLLFAPVTAITTRFDGITLSVGWTPAASALPSGQTQILLITPAGAQATISDSSTYAQMVVDSQLRSSGGDWSLYLTPQTQSQSQSQPQPVTSSGPQSDAAAVYAVAPSVNRVSVAANAAGVTLTLGVPAGITTPYFVVSILSNGQTVYTSAPLAGQAVTGGLFSVNYPFSANTLGSCQAVAALSASTASVTTGPNSQAVGLILAPPGSLRFAVSADGANRLLSATVTPPPGPWAASSSTAIVNNPDGSASAWQATGFGFTQNVTLQSPSLGAAYTLVAQVSNGPSISPLSIGTPIITSLPTLTSVAIDQGSAALAWTAVADAGVSGYQVQALSGTTVVATAVFSGTSASLALPDVPVSISVAAVGANSSGPATAPAGVINQPPTGLSSSWSTTAAGCTLSWSSVTGATDGYSIEVLRNGQSVSTLNSTTTSQQVAASVFASAGGYSFRVRASRTTAPSLLGPWSAATQIVTATSGAPTVDYDGALLNARWAPVAGAEGYRLVLLENGVESGAAWFAYSPESSTALPYDASKNYTLAVQALTGSSTGPAVTATVFGAGFYPQFAADTAAALVPATLPGMAPYKISIGLPQIFTSTPAKLPSTAPFALETGTAPYSYVLTIDGTADTLPWAFTADAIRDDLYTAYGTFLDALAEQGATAFGIQTVQAAIARSMPQTFVETLLYNYGFDGRSGWVDLKPGMVLRAEYESYQNMGGSAPDQAYLNGFITGAVAHYSITRSASNATGFTTLDAFIGWLTALGGTSVSTPAVSNRKQAGGGGLIDSGYSMMRQPFLRLVYPLSFPATDQAGTPYPEFNAVLLAAPTLAALTAATTNIRSGSAAGTNVGVLYFRGRTTLVPQIRVWVNGVEQLLSLGSSVGDILAERAMQPSAVDLPLTGISLQRGVGPALIGSPASYDASGATAVRLNWAPAGNTALTALPLLGGDRIELGTGGGSA